MAGNPNWKKGKSGNPNGRPKHSEDVILKEFRDELLQGLKPSLPKFLKDLEEIRKKDPHKASYLYIKFLQLVLPKMKEVDVTGDIGFEPVQIKIVK